MQIFIQAKFLKCSIVWRHMSHNGSACIKTTSFCILRQVSDETDPTWRRHYLTSLRREGAETSTRRTFHRRPSSALDASTATSPVTTTKNSTSKTYISSNCSSSEASSTSRSYLTPADPWKMFTSRWRHTLDANLRYRSGFRAEPSLDCKEEH